MSFLPFYKKLEEKGKKKVKTMAQQINLLWYNSFVNRCNYLCWEKKLELHMYIDKCYHVLWQASWQADKIMLNSKIFKIINISVVLAYDKGTVIL